MTEDLSQINLNRTSAQVQPQITASAKGEMRIPTSGLMKTVLRRPARKNQVTFTQIPTARSNSLPKNDVMRAHVFKALKELEKQELPKNSMRKGSDTVRETFSKIYQQLDGNLEQLVQDAKDSADGTSATFATKEGLPITVHCLIERGSPNFELQISTRRRLGEGAEKSYKEVARLKDGTVYRRAQAKIKKQLASDIDINKEIAIANKLKSKGVSNILPLEPIHLRSKSELNGEKFRPGTNIIIKSDFLEDLESTWGKVVDQLSPEQETKLTDIAISITKTILGIHKEGYCHLDLKPDNIFFEEGNVIPFVGDFGFATDIKTLIAERGSVGYIAPELFGLKKSSIPASPSSDIWSLGAIFYVAFHGENPFQDCQIDAQLNGKSNGEFLEIVETTRKELLASTNPRDHLIAEMLSINPEERPDAEKILAKLEFPSSKEVTQANRSSSFSSESQ